MDENKCNRKDDGMTVSQQAAGVQFADAWAGVVSVKPRPPPPSFAKVKLVYQSPSSQHTISASRANGPEKASVERGSSSGGRTTAARQHVHTVAASQVVVSVPPPSAHASPSSCARSANSSCSASSFTAARTPPTMPDDENHTIAGAASASVSAPGNGSSSCSSSASSSSSTSSSSSSPSLSSSSSTAPACSSSSSSSTSSAALLSMSATAPSTSSSAFSASSFTSPNSNIPRSSPSAFSRSTAAVSVSRVVIPTSSPTSAPRMSPVSPAASISSLSNSALFETVELHVVTDRGRLSGVSGARALSNHSARSAFDVVLRASSPLNSPLIERCSDSTSSSHVLHATDLKDLSLHEHNERKSAHKPLMKTTLHLVELYINVSPESNPFKYRNARPRRIITEPSVPTSNNDKDNEEGNLIMAIADTLEGAARGQQPRTRYVVRKLLGSGGFGQVVQCENLATSEPVAVKVIKNLPAYHRQAQIEIFILKMLQQKVDVERTKHTVKMLDHFTFHSHQCIVFELLGGGTLLEMLHEHRYRGLPCNIIRVLAKQVLESVSALATHNIIHCDLKPENVMFTSRHSMAVKLIDFGSAMFEGEPTMPEYVQSRFYRAPEVLLGTGYGLPVDVWSVGCIIGELFAGYPIFPGQTAHDQVRRVMKHTGLFPERMLATGKHTKKYFQLDVHSGSYTFKTKEQYARENKEPVVEPKRYLKSDTFAGLVALEEFDETLSKQEQRKERRNRLALVHLITGMLKASPSERYTAREALNHPFITGTCRTTVNVEGLLSSFDQDRLKARQRKSHHKRKSAPAVLLKEQLQGTPVASQHLPPNPTLMRRAYSMRGLSPEHVVRHAVRSPASSQWPVAGQSPSHAAPNAQGPTRFTPVAPSSPGHVAHRAPQANRQWVRAAWSTLTVPPQTYPVRSMQTQTSPYASPRHSPYMSPRGSPYMTSPRRAQHTAQGAMPAPLNGPNQAQPMGRQVTGLSGIPRHPNSPNTTRQFVHNQQTQTQQQNMHRMWWPMGSSPTQRGGQPQANHQMQQMQQQQYRQQQQQMKQLQQVQQHMQQPVSGQLPINVALARAYGQDTDNGVNTKRSRQGSGGSCTTVSSGHSSPAVDPQSAATSESPPTLPYGARGCDGADSGRSSPSTAAHWDPYFSASGAVMSPDMVAATTEDDPELRLAAKPSNGQAYPNLSEQPAPAQYAARTTPQIPSQSVAAMSMSPARTVGTNGHWSPHSGHPAGGVGTSVADHSTRGYGQPGYFVSGGMRWAQHNAHTPPGRPVQVMQHYGPRGWVASPPRHTYVRQAQSWNGTDCTGRDDWAAPAPRGSSYAHGWRPTHRGHSLPARAPVSYGLDASPPKASRKHPVSPSQGVSRSPAHARTSSRTNSTGTPPSSAGDMDRAPISAGPRPIPRRPPASSLAVTVHSDYFSAHQSSRGSSSRARGTGFRGGRRRTRGRGSSSRARNMPK